MRRPLLHFLAIGAALFGLETWLGDRAGSAAARSALSDEELLLEEARALGLHRSDPQVRRRLVRNLRFAGADAGASDDELFAEALALGMDQSDLVVRRRLVQRVVLDVQAAARREEPSEDELREQLLRDAWRYRQPSRVRLTQVFLSRDRRGGSLEADARELLADLVGEGADPEVAEGAGDALPLPVHGPPRSQRELARSFGPDFAEAVFALPPGAWQGPIASSYGLHLVWVHARQASRPARLESVRGALREAVFEERTRVALEEKLRWLRAAR